MELNDLIFFATLMIVGVPVAIATTFVWRDAKRRGLKPRVFWLWIVLVVLCWFVFLPLYVTIYRESVLASIVFVAMVVLLGVGIYRQQTSLRDRDAVVQERLNYSLQGYVQAGELKTLESLLKRGADPNFVFGQSTMLGLAARVYPRSMAVAKVKLLLKHGADPNLTTSIDGSSKIESPLLGVCRLNSESWRNGDVTDSDRDVAEALVQGVQGGADIKAVDEAGNTPVHLAAAQAESGILAFLLTKNPDLESRNRDGETPLLVAARKARCTSVRLLVDARADFKARNVRNQDALAILRHNKEIADAVVGSALFECRIERFGAPKIDRRPSSPAGYSGTLTLEGL